MTIRLAEERIAVRVFLDDLRAQLKAGTFRPLPVRERKIPKPGGSGRWRPITADGIELLDLQTAPVTRYRYRGGTIPNPWIPNHA